MAGKHALRPGRPFGRLGKTAAALAVVALLALAFGADHAYAYFTSSGSGNGTAPTTDTAHTIVISAATPTNKLQPGSSSDLAFTVNNPNNASVKITALSLNGTVTGCTTPAVTLTSPQTSYLPVTIPANQTSYPVTLTNAVAMGTSASNDCQGQTLSVPLSATVQQ